MDVAGLLDFRKHKCLVSRYVEGLTRDPIESFGKASWAQVLRADQELFRLVSDIGSSTTRIHLDMSLRRCL